MCGEEWLNCYLDTLGEKEQKEIQCVKSDTEFKFGDGKSVSSARCVSIPCRIAEKSVTVETDVVKSEIPLLLSKNSMKKANTKIDFTNDKVNIFGKEVDLQFTSSGNYAIPLRDSCKDLDSDLEESQLTEVLLTIDDIARKSNKEKQQIAIKLHRQFGRPKSSRLIDLVKSAGISDNEFLDLLKNFDESCEICIRYKKPKSRPVIGFSLAHDFNERMATDLKSFRNGNILHFVDHATRFGAGAMIYSKRKEVIIDKVFKHWMALFGNPKTFSPDNGEEFNNEDFREMGEQLNINIRITGAESPWPNGIVEKHNSVIGNMMKKKY